MTRRPEKITKERSLLGRVCVCGVSLVSQSSQSAGRGRGAGPAKESRSMGGNEALGLTHLG